MKTNLLKICEMQQRQHLGENYSIILGNNFTLLEIFYAIKLQREQIQSKVSKNN